MSDRPARRLSYDLLRLLHLLVGARDRLLGLGVDALDDGGRVALDAGLLHVRLRQARTPAASRRSRRRAGTTGARSGRASPSGRSARSCGRWRRSGRTCRGTSASSAATPSFRWAFWACEHDAVLRLVVDLELRVVGAHVALAARRRQAGDLDGRRVPGVAGGARADRPVRRSACRRVALDAAAADGRRALQADQRVRRPLARAGVVLLARTRPARPTAPSPRRRPPRTGRRAGCAGTAGTRSRGSRGSWPPSGLGNR